MNKISSFFFQTNGFVVKKAYSYKQKEDFCYPLLA